MKKLFWICLLSCFCMRVEARLPIEKVQREMQIRYNHLSQVQEDDKGRFWFHSEIPQDPTLKILWPKTACSELPPAFPPDLFYGDELLPEETLFLVKTLLRSLKTNELWKYYVTLHANTGGTTPRTRPDFLDTPCTQENCTNLFYDVETFVKTLNEIRSYPSSSFQGVSGGMNEYFLFTAYSNSLRQSLHKNRYDDLKADLFNPPPSSEGSAGCQNWNGAVDWCFGFDYWFKQWDDTNAWMSATVALLGYPQTPSSDPTALHFIQYMVGNKMWLSQPIFGEISYKKAELYLQIDERVSGSIYSGGIYPDGFTANEMNVLRHRQTLYPGDQTEKIFTSITNVPACPDPLEAAGGSQGWRLNDEETFAFVTMDYKPVSDSVAGCSSCLKTPGAVSTALNSLHVQIGLGTDEKGKLAGVLELGADRSGEDVVSPDRLRLLKNSDEIVEQFYPTYRMIYAPQSAMAVQAYADGVYTGTRVDVYTSENLTAEWAFSGRVWIVVPANGASANVFVFEEDADGNLLKETTFTPLGNGEWSKTIDKSGETLSESIDRVTDGSTNLTIRTQSDPVYGEVSRTVETYLDFDWGCELVRTEQGSGSNALWTAYEYITDTNTAGYGHVKSVVSSSGSWERYKYAANGDPFKTISSFGDQPVDADENLCRVRMTGTVQSGGEQITTDIEELLGVEIGRSYTVCTTNETRTIRCAAAGAAINAAGNQITITHYEQEPGDNSPFTGKRVVKIEHSDGTVTLKSYPSVSTNITWRGEANAGKTAVVAGTRTVEILSDFGYVKDRKVYDIASNILIDSEVITDYHFDGRPIEWQYLDGTTRRIEIGCCGVDRETGRDGSTRFFDFFDPAGHPTEITAKNADGEDVVQISNYDAAGNLRKKGYVIDGDYKWLETFVYDTAGRMTVSTNAVGGATVVTESTNGLHRVKTTVNPDLGTVIEEFYADGQLYQRTGTAAPHVRMEYGLENGEAFTKTIQLGDNGETPLWSKTFSDFLGRPYKTGYSDGSFEQSWYNGKGQVEKTVNRDGIVALFQYNAKGEREIVALDQNGNGTIDYSGMDRIVKTTAEITTAHSTAVRRTTTQIWDADNTDTPRTTAIQEVSVDGLQAWNSVEGQSTHAVAAYFPEEYYRTDTVTNPDNTQIITVTVNGQTASQEWKDSTGTTMRTLDLDYNEWGQVNQQIDSQQGTTQLGYTSSGLLASKTRVSRTDSSDTLTESYGYDSSLRITSITNADNSVTFTDYAPNGQVKKQYGAGTYPVEYGCDVQGRKTTLTTWQNYSSASGAAVTTWIYNPTNGALARKEYNDGKGTDYTYTPGGQLKTRTSARTYGSAPVSTLYSYDSLGQCTGVLYGCQNTPDISYTYDRMGRIKKAGNANAAYTYGYLNGLLTTEAVQVSGFEFQVSRHYDTLNRPSGYSLQTSNSQPQTVSYGYDSAGRFSTLTSSVSSVSSVVNYSYDPATGLPSGHSAGIAGFQPALTVTKGYDGFDRLGGITNAASSPVSAYTYGLNDLSQRTSMQMAFGTNGFSSAWNYQYDAVGQLSNAWKTASGSVVPGRQYGYQFDDIGNRKKTTRGNNNSGLLTGFSPIVTSDYTVNRLNQYSQRTVPAYAEISGLAVNGSVLSFKNENTGKHIRAGRNAEWFHAFMPLSDNSAASVSNTVRLTAVLPGQGTAGADLINTNQTLTLAAMKTPEVFTYDDDGNLLSDGRFTYTWNAENRLIEVQSRAGISPVIHAEYKYDHQGRRVSKTVNGVEMIFLWNGNHIVGEYSASKINAYIWGTGDHLVSAALNGTNVFYAHDGNKNVTDIINASGVSVAHYEFDPYGNINVKIGVLADANPFRFSNEYFDWETGFVTYKYRPYNPSFGGWLCRDPMGEQGGVNLNSFCYNDAVSFVDILGLNVYGIDGTWFNANQNPADAKISNTYNFTQMTKEVARYYGGPGGASDGLVKTYKGMTGAEISRIIQDVYKQICKDYCDSCGKITVNLVGWSRGATATLAVADKLNRKGCKCDNGCEYKPVPVNFLGLYDPVDMTILNPLDVLKILPGDQSYPNRIPSNVHNNLVQAKTEQQALYPTTHIEGANIVRYQFKNGNPTTHGNIGTSEGVIGVQQDMINAAILSGVQF